MSGSTGTPGREPSMDLQRFLDDFVSSMDQWALTETPDEPAQTEPPGG